MIRLLNSPARKGINQGRDGWWTQTPLPDQGNAIGSIIQTISRDLRQSCLMNRGMAELLRVEASKQSCEGNASERERGEEVKKTLDGCDGSSIADIM